MQSMLTNICDMESLECSIVADETTVTLLQEIFNLVEVVPFAIPVWQTQVAQQRGVNWLDDKYQVPANPFLCAVLEAAFRLASDELHVPRLTVLICRDQQHAEAIAELYEFCGD